MIIINGGLSSIDVARHMHSLDSVKSVALSQEIPDCNITWSKQPDATETVIWSDSRRCAWEIKLVGQFEYFDHDGTRLE